MGISRKNATKNKVNANEIRGSYKFEYFKFNFSFLSPNSEYNFENKLINSGLKLDIFARILDLSDKPILSIKLLGKKKGYETVPVNHIKIKSNCKSSFYDNEERVQACEDKYYIFRLYPNNNPLAIRLIGRFAKGVFYLFYIAIDHDKIYK